jgi:hypothetical protein
MILREFLEAVFEEEVRRSSKNTLADDYDKKILVPILSCSQLAKIRSSRTPEELWCLANPSLEERQQSEDVNKTLEDISTSDDLKLGIHTKS